MSNQKWILVAEDNPNDADLTMRALAVNQAPEEIVLAVDGAEALDCLYRRGAFKTRDGDPPSVILLDLKMPRVDGLEVLRQIKGDAVLKCIPVVIFTSSKEGADIIRTYQLGANAYVVKPLGYKEFMAALKDVKQFWVIRNEQLPSELLRNTDLTTLRPDVQPPQLQLAPVAR